MKKIIRFLLTSKVGKYFFTLVLRDFIEYLKKIAHEKYLAKNSNPKLDYALSFLDSVTLKDIELFINDQSTTK